MKRLIGLITTVFVINTVPVFAQDYKIGDHGPAGGLIFYVDPAEEKVLPDGITYLEAAPVDTANKSLWSNVLDKILNTKQEIGQGKANTQAIVTQEGHEYSAAKLCEDLNFNTFDDWFLPSLVELYLMYANLKVGGYDAFAANFYWSSSDVFEDGAFYINFSNGNTENYHKDNKYSVRCVRAF